MLYAILQLGASPASHVAPCMHWICLPLHLGKHLNLAVNAFNQSNQSIKSPASEVKAVILASDLHTATRAHRTGAPSCCLFQTDAVPSYECADPKQAFPWAQAGHPEAHPRGLNDYVLAWSVCSVRIRCRCEKIPV